MGKRVPESVKARAKELFMNDWSLRDIAAEVLPNSSGGFVTIHRWVKSEGWKDEKEELKRQRDEQEHQRYLGIVAEINDRHMRIAQKAVQAVELTLDAYFERDENDNVIGIKVNRWGLPAIPAVALVQLMSVATELERKTVGLDQVEQQDTERLTVESAPIDTTLAQQFGDWLAERGLLVEAPENGADSAPEESGE